jgi:hypothetical protein
MELFELKNIWQQYDEKVAENIHLNKKILKKMVITKTEKRLNRIKIETVVRLIVSILLIPLGVIPNIQYSNSVSFYFGMSMFTGLFIFAGIFRIKYFLMTDKIDFSNSVSSIRKNILELEKYHLKMIHSGLLVLPFAAISIFLICKIPLIDYGTLIPLLLVIVIFIVSYLYKTKHSFSERLKKLRIEIDELEELEKE